MWMLFALAVPIIVIMFWSCRDPEPQISSQSAPPPSDMKQMVPPRIPQYPSITFRITRWDLFANHMTLWMRNRVLQLILVLVVGWYLWSGLSRDFANASEFAIHGLLILVLYALSLVGTFAFVGLAMSFLLKQRGVICEHVLEITDEGLVERTEMNRTLHTWSSICRIMNIFGYLFVYVGDQTLHQIPRRYIPPEQMAVFEGELRARAAAAR